MKTLATTEVPQKASPKFGVNDTVYFLFGAKYAVGTVVELRGPIGVGGRHLYRVEIAPSDGEPLQFELPEPDLSSNPVEGTRLAG